MRALLGLSKSQIDVTLITASVLSVGWEGFEPPYSEESRFTVCRL